MGRGFTERESALMLLWLFAALIVGLQWGWSGVAGLIVLTVIVLAAFEK